jgi:long-chain fatty acid transport protein
MIIFSARYTPVLLLSSIVSSTAFSAGFSLNEQSARSLGQSFSGRASDADTAATLVGNPAGVSRLKQTQATGGFALIDAHTDISNNSASATVVGNTSAVNGSNDGDMIPLTAIPFGYYVQPLDSHWAAGFGIYAPFGLTTDYEDDFQGRYFGTKSAIKVITAQPTVSYKLDNGLSFGVGVTYNKFIGDLRKNIYNPVSPSSDIEAGVKGDDTAWGYNVGILYELSEDTRFGLTYYSKVKYKLEGHTDLENVPPILGLGSSVRYDATLEVTTPERIDFGFTHALTPQLTLHGDITRTNWSKLQEIRVENANASPLIATSIEPLDWDATMFYALGLSYKLNSLWTLRGGIAIDKQPIPNETRSVRLPAGDRRMAAFGATWEAMDNLSVDLSYLYIKEKEVNVEQEAETLGLPGHVNYSAKYDSYVNLIAAQINWKF